MAPFGKREDMLIHGREPFNAETAPGPLGSASLTPNDAFYARNHGPVPQVQAATWRVLVDGLVDAPCSLSIDDLRGRCATRRVVATLQCAGNRRRGLIAVRDIPGQSPWGPGATGTASWEGVALADVLALARPRVDAHHVGFVAVDVSE